MNDLNSGLKQYLTDAQLAKLASVRVGIIGAGGLGSNVAHMLVRCGVKKITIADFDRIEASNLNRQLFWPDDIGMFKVVMLGRLLRRLDSKLDLSLHISEVKEGNIREVFSDCSIIVEAVDNPKTKAMICRVFKKHVDLLVTASGISGIGGKPLGVKKISDNLICVGDFTTEVSQQNPPFMPRVMMAAALQTEAVFEYLLNK
ncbi:sulfur carrier protein ThiS adenylyltransferase ThiF [Desulfovibrio litoralis]|uniref:Sulfur carrier protein ThiS adenylyltransferase n=1 Tax=Desulfovibrio litoralis DSM 11393 TaxID=1121455 RepID=A0A1M7RR30_9BACT|nr:sulfur carrier protein ThiS adenylyltransferase ThiF [Desulfovibrio litoralis]SHN48689.1 sulfur carrier protein ThiS adenylyltransferase [Desulfovibrio litoralis DSM 11393]